MRNPICGIAQKNGVAHFSNWEAARQDLVSFKPWQTKKAHFTLTFTKLWSNKVFLPLSFSNSKLMYDLYVDTYLFKNAYKRTVRMQVSEERKICANEVGISIG